MPLLKDPKTVIAINLKLGQLIDGDYLVYFKNNRFIFFELLTICEFGH